MEIIAAIFAAVASAIGGVIVYRVNRIIDLCSSFEKHIAECEILREQHESRHMEMRADIERRISRMEDRCSAVAGIFESQKRK